MTEYETADPEVKREYDYQIARHGRITNMKRTLLNSLPAYRAYMEWYTLRDQILPFVGERGVSLFSYAISSQNDCLICSLFFRKIIIDSGDDPDHPVLSETEKLLMDFGRALCRDPHHIEETLYAALQGRFNPQELVLLFAFAGIMYATNLFNTLAKVPLDEALYPYAKEARHG
jgi:alkylhydroperoxidase family enzyme